MFASGNKKLSTWVEEWNQNYANRSGQRSETRSELADRSHKTAENRSNLKNQKASWEPGRCSHPDTKLQRQIHCSGKKNKRLRLYALPPKNTQVDLWARESDRGKRSWQQIWWCTQGEEKQKSSKQNPEAVMNKANWRKDSRSSSGRTSSVQEMKSTAQI
jgi:hypothetical protein